ncbi:hypothetical protein AB0K74_24345 [Streptomyces sp. NPDC056159]|uniref:hypothetical protein n=1 Tax=unclassified Streptomyces TaxID=2593676 RepID=UPI003423E44F
MYQWQRCNARGTGCASIAGATRTTYGLAAADVGKRLRINVTATNVDGHSTARSAVTTVVKKKCPSAALHCRHKLGDAVRPPTRLVTLGRFCGMPELADPGPHHGAAELVQGRRPGSLVHRRPTGHRPPKSSAPRLSAV